MLDLTPALTCLYGWLPAGLTQAQLDQARSNPISLPRLTQLDRCSRRMRPANESSGASWRLAGESPVGLGCLRKRVRASTLGSAGRTSESLRNLRSLVATVVVTEHMKDMADGLGANMRNQSRSNSDGQTPKLRKLRREMSLGVVLSSHECNVQSCNPDLCRSARHCWPHWKVNVVSTANELKRPSVR